MCLSAKLCDMAARGKLVWVRDPALADEDVFVKGKIISEDEKQVCRSFTKGSGAWLVMCSRPDAGRRLLYC